MTDRVDCPMCTWRGPGGMLVSLHTTITALNRIDDDDPDNTPCALCSSTRILRTEIAAVFRLGGLRSAMELKPEVATTIVKQAKWLAGYDPDTWCQACGYKFIWATGTLSPHGHHTCEAAPDLAGSVLVGHVVMATENAWRLARSGAEFHGWGTKTWNAETHVQAANLRIGPERIEISDYRPENSRAVASWPLKPDQDLEIPISTKK